jgi:signal transduction histidine kinase
MQFSNTEKGNNAVTNLVGILLIAVIGIIDLLTGNEVSFSIFYLIPIVYVTWFGRRRVGYLYAFAAAVTWFYIDSLGESQITSNAIPYWNAIVRFGFFSIVVFLTGELKVHRIHLERKIEERTGDLMKEIEDHKRSKEELLQKTELLSKLTGRIERIKEEENTRIAREIHDELGQYLTAINLEVNWIKKKYSSVNDLTLRTTNISEMVDETIKTVRKISYELRPRLLDQLGVFPAIESSLRDLQKKTKIRCYSEIDVKHTNLSPNVSASVYRIFQEAITNIVRHSKATSVNVKINSNGSGNLNMNISDNGIGFNSNSPETLEKKSLGIIGMKERALLLGGTLDIESAPNTGTEVKLRIPVSNK